MFGLGLRCRGSALSLPPCSASPAFRRSPARSAASNKDAPAGAEPVDISHIPCLQRELGFNLLMRRTPCIVNPELAAHVADHLEPIKGETFIEANPGIGLLTKELLQRGAHHVTSVQASTTLNPVLQAVGKEFPPSRFRLLEEDLAFSGHIGDDLLENVQRVPWTSDKPAARIVGFSPMSTGSRFIFHSFHQLNERDGMFQKGPVDLLVLMPAEMAQYFDAKGTDKMRLRERVLANTMCKVTFGPRFSRHSFLPPVSHRTVRALVPKADMVLVNFEPRRERVLSEVEYIYLNFLLRLVCYKRNVKLTNFLGRKMKLVDPRADRLLVDTALHPDTPVEEVTMEQYQALARACARSPSRQPLSSITGASSEEDDALMGSKVEE